MSVNKKLKEWGINLGLIIGGIIIFFIILEVGLFIHNPQLLKEGVTAGVILYQDDEILGWKHIPCSSGVQLGNTNEYSVNASINSKGLRDKEYNYTKPEFTKRIIVLGDSMTWGHGVEYGERFTEFLENSLKNTQVINMGVPGYSTDQELLFLKEEGLKYSPDLMILCFMENDFGGNMVTIAGFYQKPKYVLTNESLLLTNVPVHQSSFLPLIRFLYRHSYSYHFISDRLVLGNVHRKLEFATNRENKGTTQPKEDSCNLTQAIIKEMDIIAKSNNATTLVVLINYGENVCSGNSTSEDIRLINFCDENNISILNLLPAFHTYYLDTNEQLYYEKDGHWNANGHKLAAELIYDKLIEEQLISLGGEH